MDSTIWTAIAAVATFLAVVVAFLAIVQNQKQAKANWEHTQQIAREDRQHALQLAREDRQHQTRPVMVPIGDIPRFNDIPNKVGDAKPLMIQNIGNGPAFNVHGALYFHTNVWYSSWNNGPVPAGEPREIVFEHGQIGLGPKNSVDGTYHLYNTQEEWNYRPGRLTMTYRDLFGILHVSVFDYIVPAMNEHRWVQVAIKSGIEKDLEDLDFEVARNARKLKPNH